MLWKESVPLRLRRRKNLISRLDAVSSLLWPEPESGTPLGAAEGRKLFLEIGSGMGGFITHMALRQPEDFFLAVERDKNVAIRAVEKAGALKLDNIRFCLCDAGELERLLPPGRVSGLYLNFSDPWPRRRHAHRRLTHRRYLHLYATLLGEMGTLTLKTDNESLFLFTETELCEARWRILSRDEDLPDGEDNILTEYEARFRAGARPIYRITAQPPLIKEE